MPNSSPRRWRKRAAAAASLTLLAVAEALHLSGSGGGSATPSVLLSGPLVDSTEPPPHVEANSSSTGASEASPPPERHRQREGNESSPEREGSFHWAPGDDDDDDDERCLISSRGKDGVGHQLEAKLSCVGAAAFFRPSSVTYVHFPLGNDVLSAAGRRGDSDETTASRLERLLGLGLGPGVEGASLAGGAPLESSKTGIIIPAFNHETMAVRERSPLPRVGDCAKPSWFDRFDAAAAPRANGNATRPSCRAEVDPSTGKTKWPVYVADNCWDAFWCGLVRRPREAARAWREKALPVLRASYLRGSSTVGAEGEGGSSSSARANGTASSSGSDLDLFVEEKEATLNVVFHIRRDDASRYRIAKLEYHAEILKCLRRAAGEIAAANSPGAARLPLRLVVHTDGDLGEVARGLGLLSFDSNHSSSDDSAPPPTTISLDGGFTRASLHGRDFPFNLLFRQMIECDLFVASKSSVSHAAGLLREYNGNVVDGAGGRSPDPGVIYPETWERVGAIALGWTVMKYLRSGLKMAHMPPQLPPPGNAASSSVLLRGNGTEASVGAGTDTRRHLMIIRKSKEAKNLRWATVPEEFWTDLIERRGAIARGRWQRSRTSL